MPRLSTTFFLPIFAEKLPILARFEGIRRSSRQIKKAGQKPARKNAETDKDI
jgi:hypothetical protein